MYITIGMPIIEVTEFIGNIIFCAGSCDKISLISIVILPINMPEGINILWSDVLYISLAMCGTAIPINPIGPQNAVTAPVIMPVDIKIILRE